MAKKAASAADRLRIRLQKPGLGLFFPPPSPIVNRSRPPLPGRFADLVNRRRRCQPPLPASSNHDRQRHS